MTYQDIRKKIGPVLRRQGVIKAALFGSAARGCAKVGSDIDLLVDMPKNKTLFDLVGLKLKLAAKLGKKVDVVTYRSIHPMLRERILGEQKVIYEKRS